MTAASLAVASVLDAGVTALFALIGWRLSQRRVSDHARLASALFATWWYSLAVISATAFVRHAMAATATVDLVLVQTLGYVSLIAICTALWGLLYYLVYLFTGWRAVIYPITVFYVAFYLALLYVTVALGSPTVVTHTWTVDVVYERPPDPVLVTSLLVLVLAPHIVGAIAYGTLFFRLEDPTARWRVAIVAMSIVVWFGTSYVAASLGASPAGTWPLLKRLLDTLSALCILLAYLPPWFVRQRWGVKGIDDPSGAG